MKDILIALWVAIAGALFVASPLVADAFPGVFLVVEAVGRGAYAVALAACVLVIALRVTRSLAPRGRRTGTGPWTTGESGR